ncbi:hypothetical protein F5I97DRAFT_1367902 [Phlebopus sp. FC_14]|nr:hypothetical protein F5I97DRAFT_1367902 [Phlebopus sp. FC_14]
MTVEQRQSSSAAGDSGASSSAQVLQYPNSQSQDGVEPFQPAGFNLLQYDSPLAAYPRLRSRLRPATRGSDSILASAQTLSELTIASPVVPSSSLQSSSSPICITSRTPYSVPSHSSTLLSFPDLKVLKQAVQARALGQLMASNASLRVCQYEVPGGGVCRDIDCDELHLSRISSEPSDAELAAYVHSTLPEPWCRWCDVHAIEIALDGVRLRGGAKDADTRVREALAGLGIPIG